MQGTVCGVLYYFPYENDHETVPTENPSTSNIKPILSGAHAAPTQMPLGAGMLTQAPMPSQRDGSKDGASDEEDTDVVNWRTPIFEAFWQGRLIPGARIDSLPFIESVRQKRNAQTKVYIRSITSINYFIYFMLAILSCVYILYL